MQVNKSLRSIRNVSKAGVYYWNPISHQFLRPACAPAMARLQADLGLHCLKFPCVVANLKPE